MEMGQKQLERALKANNPDYCRRIIVTSLMPGPARYDIVNGCYAGYATATGDVSLCMDVIAPGLCVSAMAEKRDDPELCKRAIDPRRPETDRRGSCFGYFAKKESEYEYCQRLINLENMNDHQKIVCMMLYVDTTGDAKYCTVHDKPDICYNKAARISRDASVCELVGDEVMKDKCIKEVSTGS